MRLAYSTIFYFVIAFLLSSLIPAIIYLGKYSYLAILVLFPFLLWGLIEFHKHFIFFYIFSLFIGRYFYYDFRIEAATFVSYLMFVFFIVNSRTSLFNDYILPVKLKISAFILIFSVVLSAINSPFVSLQSVFYAYLFITFIFSSYLIFRSVSEKYSPEVFLNYYIYSAAFSAVIIIFQIIFTGNIRSVGLSDLGIIDMLICAFLMVLFRYFLLEKLDFKFTIIFCLLLIVSITTQSRFAWLGFLLAFIYGLFISLIYKKKLFGRKLPLAIFLIVFALVVIYFSGLSDVISNRLINIKPAILESNEERLEISNSLDTRILIWITAFKAFLSNPFTGVGYMMFNYVSENYNILPYHFYESLVKGLDAHSTYLGFLCETGLFGLLSFLAYVAIIFVYSMRSIKISFSESELHNSIVINIVVFFIIVHSIYAGSFNFGHDAFFMHFIFGLSMGNYVYLRRKRIT